MTEKTSVCVFILLVRLCLFTNNGGMYAHNLLLIYSNFDSNHPIYVFLYFQMLLKRKFGFKPELDLPLIGSRTHCM